MSAILRLPAVKTRTGLGRSTIYALISRGDFPKPVLLGTRAVGFLEHEIDAWISARVEQSRGKKVVTLPDVHGDPSTAIELRPGTRFASPGLRMGRQLAIGNRFS